MYHCNLLFCFQVTICKTWLVDMLIVLSQWLTSLSRPYEVHYFRALILLSSTRVCGVTQEGPGDPAHKAAARRTPHRTCPVPGDYNISCYCGEHWPVSRLSSLFVILTLFTLLTSAAMVLGPIVFIVSTSKYFPRQQLKLLGPVLPPVVSD